MDEMRRALQAERQSALARVSELETELSALSDSALAESATAEQTRAEAAQLRSRNEELDLGLEEMRGDLLAREQRLEDSETRAAGALARISELETANEAAAARAGELETQLAALRDSTAASEQRAAELGEALSARAALLEETDTKLAAAETVTQQLRVQLAAEVEGRASEDTARQELHRRLAEAEADAERARAEVTDLATRLNGARAEVDAARAAGEAAHVDGAAASARLAARVEKLEGQLAAASRELGDHRDAAERSQATIAELEQTVAQRLNEALSAAEELEDARSEVAAGHHREDALQDDIEAMRTAMQTTRGGLSGHTVVRLAEVRGVVREQLADAARSEELALQLRERILMASALRRRLSDDGVDARRDAVTELRTVARDGAARAEALEGRALELQLRLREMRG